jgi:hypothetical protein
MIIPKSRTTYVCPEHRTLREDYHGGVKVSEFVYGRLQSPDLDQAEAFLTAFGMSSLDGNSAIASAQCSSDVTIGTS